MKPQRRNFLLGAAGATLAAAGVTSEVSASQFGNSVLPELCRVVTSVEDFYSTFSDLVHKYAFENYYESYDKLILSPKIYNAITNSEWFEGRLKKELRYCSDKGSLRFELDPSVKKQMLSNILNMNIFVQTVQNTEVFLPNNVMLITNSTPSNRPTHVAKLTIENL